MTGEHDEKADDEQPPNLLVTGPIVIRGFGRSVIDALLPGRPSRHREVHAEREAVSDDGPVASALEGAPMRDSSGVGAPQGGGPESLDAEDGAESRADDADGSEEDRVDDHRDAAHADGDESTAAFLEDPADQDDVFDAVQQPPEDADDNGDAVEPSESEDDADSGASQQVAALESDVGAPRGDVASELSVQTGGTDAPGGIADSDSALDSPERAPTDVEHFAGGERSREDERAEAPVVAAAFDTERPASVAEPVHGFQPLDSTSESDLDEDPTLGDGSPPRATDGPDAVQQPKDDGEPSDDRSADGDFPQDGDVSAGIVVDSVDGRVIESDAASDVAGVETDHDVTHDHERPADVVPALDESGARSGDPLDGDLDTSIEEEGTGSFDGRGADLPAESPADPHEDSAELDMSPSALPSELDVTDGNEDVEPADRSAAHDGGGGGEERATDGDGTRAHEELGDPEASEDADREAVEDATQGGDLTADPFHDDAPADVPLDGLDLHDDEPIGQAERAAIVDSDDPDVKPATTSDSEAVGSGDTWTDEEAHTDGPPEVAVAVGAPDSEALLEQSTHLAAPESTEELGEEYASRTVAAEQLSSGAPVVQRPARPAEPSDPAGEDFDESEILHDVAPASGQAVESEGDTAAARPSSARAAGSSAERPPRSPGGSSAPGPRSLRRPRPARRRLGREAVGIAVLVVLALVCAGLIAAVVVKTRNDAAIAAQEAADYTPPPLATPEPTSSGPVVAVIGDGTTSTAASGVGSAQRWSRLLASSLGGTVDATASSGMGYAAKSSAGQTFVTAASRIPSNAEVVVFFGGAADVNISTLSLAKAATDAYSAAGEQAPDAKLVVVGPAVAAGASNADLTEIRNTLRSAAGIAKATWIDPVGSKWLSADRQKSTATGLTASDEKVLATRMKSAVEAALQ